MFERKGLLKCRDQARNVLMNVVVSQEQIRIRWRGDPELAYNTVPGKLFVETEHGRSCNVRFNEGGLPIGFEYVAPGYKLVCLELIDSIPKDW